MQKAENIVVGISKVLWLWRKTLDERGPFSLQIVLLVVGLNLYVLKKNSENPLFYLNKLNAIFVLDSNKSINPFCADLN